MRCYSFNDDQKNSDLATLLMKIAFVGQTVAFDFRAKTM